MVMANENDNFVFMIVTCGESNEMIGKMSERDRLQLHYELLVIGLFHLSSLKVLGIKGNSLNCVSEFPSFDTLAIIHQGFLELQPWGLLCHILLYYAPHGDWSARTVIPYYAAVRQVPSQVVQVLISAYRISTNHDYFIRVSYTLVRSCRGLFGISFFLPIAILSSDFTDFPTDGCSLQPPSYCNQRKGLCEICTSKYTFPYYICGWGLTSQTVENYRCFGIVSRFFFANVIQGYCN